MKLNTAIWGDSSTWVQSAQFQYNLSDKYHVSYGKYVRIDQYMENDPDNFQYNQLFDNTIAYCGHAEGVSPFGDRAVFYYSDNQAETSNVEPLLILNDTTSITFAGWNSGTRNNMPNISSHIETLNDTRGCMTGLLDMSGESATIEGCKNTRWLPNAGSFDERWNNTLALKPVVDFSPYAFYGVIMVTIKDPISGDSRTETLYSAITNYASYQIVNAHLALKRPAGSGSDPDFENIISAYSFERFGAISLDTIPYNSLDYINYSDNLSDLPGLPIFGFSANVNLLSGYNIGFSWVTYHYSDRDYANLFSRAPIFYGYSLATFDSVSCSKGTNDSSIVLKFHLDINENTYEKLMQYAACYGIFFTDGKTDLRQVSNRWIHEDMCLGLLRNGVGYGEYTRGADNVNNPAYNWTSSHDSGYLDSSNIYVGDRRVNRIYLGSRQVNKLYVGDKLLIL